MSNNALPQESRVFDLIPVFEEAGTDRGAADGDDLQSDGVCRLGAPDPPRIEGAEQDVSRHEEATRAEPNGKMGVPLLWWYP